MLFRSGRNAPCGQSRGTTRQLISQRRSNWRAFEYLSHGTLESQAVGEFLRDAIRDRLATRDVGIECGKCGVVCIKRP